MKFSALTSWMKSPRPIEAWRAGNPLRRAISLGLAWSWMIGVLYADIQWVTDPNVARTIRQILQMPAGEIGAVELARVTRLDLSSLDLSAVTLPRGMTNLVTLTLDHNRLQEIELPADLMSLEYLDLGANELKVLTLPPALSRLRNCYATRNQLTNLVLPDPLASLEILILGDNRLSRIDLPSGLGRLRELHLNNNRLTNVVFKPGLSNLQTLNLDGNRLYTVDFLNGLGSLRSLRLWGNPITDATLSTDLQALQVVDLSLTAITNLTVAPGLRQLRTIHVDTPTLRSVMFPLSYQFELVPGPEELQSRGVIFYLNPQESHDTSPDVIGCGWKYLTEMNTPHQCGAAVAVDGAIYVLGGIDRDQHQFEVYHPQVNEWRTLPNMPTARYFLGAAAAGRRIVAIGGVGAGSRVEIYEVAAAAWSRGRDLPTSRNRLAAVCVGTTIFAIGGFEANSNTGSVEAYDVETDTCPRRRADQNHRLSLGNRWQCPYRMDCISRLHVSTRVSIRSFAAILDHASGSVPRSRDGPLSNRAFSTRSSPVLSSEALTQPQG